MDTITIDSKQFQQLLDSFEKMSNMLALNLVKDCAKQNEKIVRLSYFGFSPSDISKMLNLNANTVNVTLSRARKAKTENKDSKSGKQESISEDLTNVT
jgi:DNA-directed RNA polymerase specialized sigma24 family protein